MLCRGSLRGFGEEVGDLLNMQPVLVVKEDFLDMLQVTGNFGSSMERTCK